MNSLPPTWSIGKLKEFVEVNPRRPAELRSLPADHEVTFVPMPSVDQFSGAISHPIVRPFSEVKKGFTYFVEDDVIFAKITPCMQNGKSAIARGLANGLGMGSTEFHVLRCNQARVIPEWIWYFVRNPDLRREAVHHFRGAVGQQRVPAAFLAECDLPTPPLAEQRRIVARIDEMMERIDEAVQLRESSAKEIDHLEGAVFADFVERHIDGNGVPVLPLGQVLTRTQYGSSSKANTQRRGTPMLRMGNIKDGHLDVSDLKHIELDAVALSKYQLNHGDILINRTNSLERVGKAAVFDLGDGPWVFASYLVRLVVDESRVLPQYVSAATNSRIGRRYVHQTARRAIGMVNINVKEIKAMPLPIPSLEAQRDVVARMADVRHAVSQMRSNSSAFDASALRGSILRKAFAGEL